MGNSDCKGVQNSSRHSFFKKNYEKDVEINHQVLGNLNIYQRSQTGQMLAIKLHAYSNLLEAENLLVVSNQDIQTRYEGINHIYFAQQSESNPFVIKIFFEWIPSTLADHINERRGNNYQFTEEEIWNTSANILTAMRSLQKQGVCHGDLRPENVSQSYEDGQLCFQLWDNQIINGFKDAYFLTRNKQFTNNLSPQQLTELQSKSPPLFSKSILYANDVWALGIILLEMGTFLNRSTFYFQNNNHLNEPGIEMALAQMKQNYSDRLNQFVRGMLVTDEKSRYTAEELFQFYDYQQKKSQILSSSKSLSNLNSMYSINRGNDHDKIKLMSAETNQSNLNSPKLGIPINNYNNNHINVSQFGFQKQDIFNTHHLPHQNDENFFKSTSNLNSPQIMSPRHPPPSNNYMQNFQHLSSPRSQPPGYIPINSMAYPVQTFSSPKNTTSTYFSPRR